MLQRQSTLVAVATVMLIANPLTAFAQQANQGQVPPFFAPFFKQQQTQPQAARPFWAPAPTARRQQPAAALFFPWFKQPAPTPGFGYQAPTYSAGFMAPFQSGSNLMNPGMNMNIFMAPMMQGAMGFMAPMAMNYAVASMNPTTMTNFFQLMAQPNTGFGGMGFGPMPMFGSPFGAAPRAPTFPFATQTAPATFPNPFTAFFGVKR